LLGRESQFIPSSHKIFIATCDHSIVSCRQQAPSTISSSV
jgi:hypothetical protein